MPSAASFAPFERGKELILRHARPAVRMAHHRRLIFGKRGVSICVVEVRVGVNRLARRLVKRLAMALRISGTRGL
jgi:hypothetical protein